MTYACQQYTITRLCRYDRRAIDRKCDGCQRTTDSEYLKSMGLWVEGVSHENDATSMFLVPDTLPPTGFYINKFNVLYASKSR